LLFPSVVHQSPGVPLGISRFPSLHHAPRVLRKSFGPLLRPLPMIYTPLPHLPAPKKVFFFFSSCSAFPSLQSLVLPRHVVRDPKDVPNVGLDRWPVYSIISESLLMIFYLPPKFLFVWYASSAQIPKSFTPTWGLV